MHNQNFDTENEKYSRIRFGPAGIPIQCDGGTLEGIKCCKKLGLNAMEMEFVHGVRMHNELAKEVGKTAKELDIILSSHAPYYVNLCSKEDIKVRNSQQHIIQAAKITATAGGRITVFHPGYYQKLDRESAFQTAKKNLKKIEEQLDGIKIILGAETVGKKSAFGGLIENIRLSQELTMVQPVIDFAHLIARGDFKLKTKEDYKKVFDIVENEIPGYVKSFHSHFSEINYSDKGERNHLILGEKNEPPYKPLIELVEEQGYAGVIICETPKIDYDAMKMQRYYLKMRGKHVG